MKIDLGIKPEDRYKVNVSAALALIEQLYRDKQIKKSTFENIKKDAEIMLTKNTKMWYSICN